MMLASLALEKPDARLTADIDIKVARGRATQSSLAFAGEANAGAVLDAGGDGDR